jgi:hypothetical protein
MATLANLLSRPLFLCPALWSLRKWGGQQYWAAYSYTWGPSHYYTK